MLRTFVFAAVLAAVVPSATAQTAMSDIHAPHVTMYAAPDCGYCAKARAWFDENGVAFEERDVTASAQAAAEWRARGGVGTPTIVIGETVIQGFDPRRIKAAMALAAG
jgi:glutaredoxin